MARRQVTQALDRKRPKPSSEKNGSGNAGEKKATSPGGRRV